MTRYEIDDLVSILGLPLGGTVSVVFKDAHGLDGSGTTTFLSCDYGTDNYIMARYEVMMEQDRDFDEYDLSDGDNLSDADADAMTLASAGWGTDEDYGYFGEYEGSEW